VAVRRGCLGDDGGAGAAGGVATAVGAGADWRRRGRSRSLRRPATTTPIAVSFQMFARLDSFMAVRPPSGQLAPIVPSDSRIDFAGGL
jgi:hypothetical protein